MKRFNSLVLVESRANSCEWRQNSLIEIEHLLRKSYSSSGGYLNGRAVPRKGLM